MHQVVLGIFLLSCAVPMCMPACKVVPVGQCSMYGICLGIVSTTAKTAPTISLITTAAAPATTTIKLGYTYTACASGQQPYTGAECELGATAQDSQSGNLTSQVLVCAPAACITLACMASKSPTPLNSCVTGLQEWLLQRIDQTSVSHMQAALTDLTHNHRRLFKRLASPVSLRQTAHHHRGAG